MRFFGALTTLALAASATAAAVGTASITRRDGSVVSVRSEPKKCLCQSDVDELTNAYTSMLGHWEDKWADYLNDESFVDWSDSINLLAKLEPGFPIFPNKAAFLAHQATNPDNLPNFKIEKLGPWNCDSISFVWSTTFSFVPGGVPKPVRGVTILGATKGEEHWVIKTLDVEFNNIQFLKNIGGSVTYPAPPPAASST
jgi:hypothetical protein